MESERFESMLDKLKDGKIARDRITLRTLFNGAYRKDALIAAIYWVGNAFTFWSFLAFVPLYLVKVRHLDSSTELTYLGFWQIFYALVPLLAGWLGDHWGRRPTAITFAVLAAIGVWATTMVPSGPLLFLVGGLTYGAVAAPWIISFAHAAESFPTHIRGTAIGSTMAVGRLVAIVAPIVVRRICRTLRHRFRASGGDGRVDLHDPRLSPEQGNQGLAPGGDIHLSKHGGHAAVSSI